MLTSLNRMIGLPVVLHDQRIGSVERAVPDALQQKLDGLVIRRGIGGAKWVPASAVELVGERCVLIRRKPCRAPELPPEGGTAAISTTGERIGEVTDGLLKGDTLRMVALEVSLGPLYRLMGKSAYAVGYQARTAQRTVIAPKLMTWAELTRMLGEGDDG